MNYSLGDYFNEAQVQECPVWFKYVDLYFRDRETKLFVPGKPRWHQITGLNLVSTFTRSGLYDDMGAGKTLVAQARIAWLAAYGNRSVCLMPPILMGQFMRSLQNTFRDKAGNPGELFKHFKIEIFHGTVPQRNKMLARWKTEGFPHIVISTYELFRKEFTIFTENNYDYIVCDEAKLLANPRTDAAVSVHSFLGEKYGERGVLLMNGTPAMNQLIELWGYIKLITPNIYMSTHDFYLKHVDVEDIHIKYTDRQGIGKERTVEKIVGYRDRDTLYKHLYLQARRVESKDVLELPELNIETVDIDLSKAHLAQYKQLVDERILFFDDGSMIDAVSASKLRQLCMQSVNNPEELNLTCDSAVLEYADSLLSAGNVEEHKIVVFAHYQKTVRKLKERWKKYNPATIFGGADNEAELQKFLNDPTCRIAVVNYQSGGVGLELQHVSHTVICVEPNGVPGLFWQALKRVHREGQNRHVNVYVLLANNTLFAKLYSDMVEKNEVNASVVSRAQLLRELLGESVKEFVAKA